MKPFALLLKAERFPTLLISYCHNLSTPSAKSITFLSQTKPLSTTPYPQNTEWAGKVLDRIPHPDLSSFKATLKSHLMNERYLNAIRLYQHMRQHLCEQDNVVFSLVLRACVKLLDLDEGKKLHCHITKVGNPDCFLLNVLLDMYAKCGELGGAMRVFDEIPDRNVFSWTSIISGCIQNECPEQGLVMFNHMRLDGVKPSDHTMGSLLTACSMTKSLHQGKWVHGFVSKSGMNENSFLATSLVDMYVKCDQVTDARSIFDEFGDVDVVLWTAMIVGYAQKGCPMDALKLFCDDKQAVIVPNSVTISTVLSASSKLKSLNLGRSIHSFAVKLGLEGYSVIRNSLVDMYAKCSAIWEAKIVFERILQKDVVTYNAMITGYSDNGLGNDALELFNRMRLGGCLPDAVTVVAALSACVCLVALSIGCSFHAYSLKSNFLPNVHVGTALLNLYNKCGELMSARSIFDEMSNRNTVTWCAMMTGYGMQGDSISSLNLFRNMVEEDINPNDVTFTSILSTCSHTGMVVEGQKLFESMSQNHNIVPSMKHYVCMVDMLARTGKLEEALAFIERMPVHADIRVWAALLHGCRLHSQLEIGEVAVRRMQELEPVTPAYYVLMSNLYASDGRWDETVKIRELMKERGMMKLPGASFIGMDRGLHSYDLNARIS